MTLSASELDELEKRLDDEITRSSVDQLKARWLSKEGVIKSLYKQLRDIPPDERPSIAERLNVLRDRVEALLEQEDARQSAARLQETIAKDHLDLSLPPLATGIGASHPITRLENQVTDILRPFGFKVVEGPEIETEYFCFDALNIPPHHPARDMQDTFHTESGHVLRTHTTSVQARVLKEGGLPVKVLSIGRVYRNEAEDTSHQAMFHQYELIWLANDLTLANLLGLIEHVLKQLYGKRRKVQFVPKFYPYTEPSIGPQIDCALCRGAGCASCGGSGFVTVGGAGMIHRKVLEEFGYDPSKVSGFAWGLGTSRLAAQMFHLPHMRALYENDLRILRSI